MKDGTTIGELYKERAPLYEKYADIIYQKMYDYCGLSEDEPPTPTKYMERTLGKMEILKEWMGF